MIVVAYDPVAGEVTIDGKNGTTRVWSGKEGLLVKHYREDGIFYCELRSGEALLVFYDPDKRVIPLALTPAGQGRWRVVPVPAGP